MNIAIGEPSGGGGGVPNFKKYATEAKRNNRPSRPPAIIGKYFITMMFRTLTAGGQQGYPVNAHTRTSCSYEAKAMAFR